jgi:hypothetical protein
MARGRAAACGRGQWPGDGGPTGLCQPARLARTRSIHRGWSRRGGTGGQGSPVAPVQRGRRREYEDGEGRSSGKEDGDTAHQGGLGSDEVGDGEARRSSRGGGARRRPTRGELAGIDLGTSVVLVEVKAAPEVDRTGSATCGPQRLVDGVDRRLWGCSG